MIRRLTLILIGLAAAGCMTVSPLDSLSGGTARQAWQELASASGASGTLSSYASIRVTTPEGRRSFRATIQSDDRGRVRMSAFTPVGTEVFAFEVEGEEMLFAEHSSRKSWRGPFSEVAVQLGIPRELEASDFARLVFGLPAGTGDADLSDVSRGVVTQGGLKYEITGLGLGSVSKTGTSWRARYEPGVFPPEKVTFEDDSGRSIVVRHLDLSHSRGRIEPLVVDGSYACCFRPTIAAE